MLDVYLSYLISDGQHQESIYKSSYLAFFTGTRRHEIDRSRLLSTGRDISEGGD